MTPFNKDLLWVSIATLALTGCGSSSNSSSDSGDDHDHEHESSILVSQTGTTALSLLEDGELEAVGDAVGNSPVNDPITLVLSETGAYAAVLNVSSTMVSFVHGLHEEEGHDEEEHEHEEEAHVLEFDLPGSKVITTNGHFAVLNSDSTTFVEYDELETITVAPDAINVGTETYPALMIEEGHGDDHEVLMVFAGGTAAIYEDGEAVVGDSFTCTNPTSHGQTHELVVVSCDEGALTVVIEEDDVTGEHTFTEKNITLDGTEANYTWQAQGHVIVGFAPETTDYAIVELDESGSSPEVVEGGDTGSIELSRNICDIKLDSEEQDVLVLVAGDETNAGDKLVVLSHKGEALVNVTLNSSTNTDCDNLVMASASKNVLVVDNSAKKAYDIDAHDSGDYHVHDTYELDVSGIASAVIFHEKDEDADHHDDH